MECAAGRDLNGRDLLARSDGDVLGRISRHVDVRRSRRGRYADLDVSRLGDSNARLLHPRADRVRDRSCRTGVGRSLMRAERPEPQYCDIALGLLVGIIDLDGLNGRQDRRVVLRGQAHHLRLGLRLVSASSFSGSSWLGAGAGLALSNLTPCFLSSWS